MRKDRIGAPVPVEEEDGPVFRRRQLVGIYYGETLDDERLLERYQDKDHRMTARYTLQTTGEDDARVEYSDAICAQSAVSYINEAVDVGALMERHKTKAAFTKAYDALAREQNKDLQTAGKRGGKDAFLLPGANCDFVGADDDTVDVESTRPVYHGEELLTNYGAVYWKT